MCRVLTSDSFIIFRIRKLCLTVLLGLLAMYCSGLPAEAAQNTTQQSPYMEEREPVYHAFVFGNDLYTSLPEIRSAAQDFREMKRYFLEAGYRVWDMNGTGRFTTVDEFYEYMTRAREEIQPGDAVVIYYSGHGFHFGNQDWLGPLGYPEGIVDQQMLFEHAVGLKDIITGLSEKRIDYAVAIIDACRTEVPFKFRNENGSSVVGDTPMPDFNYQGPSLIAWNIGVPAYAGGTANGSDAAGETSLYTRLLLRLLKTRPRISELQAELKVAIKDLIDTREIMRGDLDPRFIGGTDFSFNKQTDIATSEKRKRTWRFTMAEPSRQLVRSYLMLNPGSRFSTAAWKYLDDHASEPEDIRGSSLSLAEAIDTSFPEGKRSGKLVAVATSGFSVNFPRNTVGLPGVAEQSIADLIVYSDRPDDISGAYEARYALKGSKLNFDIDMIVAAGAVAVNTGQIARREPRPGAQGTFKFNKPAAVEINRTFFETSSKKLYADIGLNRWPTGLPVTKNWASFDYRGSEQPSFNVLNRALREVVINDNGMSIAQIADEVRQSSTDILWVSIAVDYQPIDVSALQLRRSDATTDAERAAIERELNDQVQKDRRALAAAQMLALEARNQLIEAGVDRLRITTVNARRGELSTGAIRLRFFGSR